MLNRVRYEDGAGYTDIPIGNNRHIGIRRFSGRQGHRALMFRRGNMMCYGIRSILSSPFWLWFLTGYECVRQWNQKGNRPGRDPDSFRWTKLGGAATRPWFAGYFEWVSKRQCRGCTP